MELIQHYLEEVQKINGIYVLHYPEDTTAEMLERIHADFTKRYPGEQLLVMPQGMSIHRFNKYSFYLAMMLIRHGRKLTRLQWITNSNTKKEAPYLVLEEVDGHEVLLRKWPNQPEEDEFFFIEQADMDADDYVLVVD